MGKRSRVTAMPKAMKEWLDTQLVEGEFSGYELLAAELKARGYEISKSALHRYGSRFQQQLGRLKESAEKARAVVAASPDDDDDMSQALMRLTQAKLMDVMEAVEFDPEKTDLSKLTLHVSRLVRASLPLKQWKAQAKAKAGARLDQAVSQAEAAGGALSVDVIRKIREDVYGIFEQ